MKDLLVMLYIVFLSAGMTSFYYFILYSMEALESSLTKAGVC